MATQEFLRRRQAKSRALGPTGYQRIENRILQIFRNSGAIVLDLDGCDNRVPTPPYRIVMCRAGPRDYRAVPFESSYGIAQDIQHGLYNLPAIERQVRQARVVLTLECELSRRFGFDQPDDVFEDFVNIDRALLRAPAWTQ